MTETYQGLPCPDCAGTERHTLRNTCVACYRKAKADCSKNVQSTAPPALVRPRNWPKVETRAGDTVHADPIFMQMRGGS